MNTGQLLKLHKKLSMTALILCLFWIVSGFMHPIMGWVRPVAAKFRSPENGISEKGLRGVKQILKQQKNLDVESVRLVNFSEGQFYQVASGNETLYFDSETGTHLSDGDDKYALYLARYYSQKKGDVKAVVKVNSFDYRYPFINRLLPVQKVSFLDGEDYYIHTRSSRLGTVGNELKDGMSLVFKLFHNLSVLDNYPVFKLFITSVFMFILVFVTCTGLLFFFKTWKKKRSGMRQWHRLIGLGISVVIFSLCFSGLFHMTVKNVLEKKGMPVFSLNSEIWQKDFAELLANKSDVKEASTAIIQGKQYLRIVSAGIGESRSSQVSYVSLTSDEVLSEKEAVTLLASQFADKEAGEIQDLKLITRFSGEYGFVNKRLPVWKVTFKNTSERFYIETSSQKLALKVTPLKSVEGFSFTYLHKAHFLDFLGKNGRNITLMIFCVLIGFVAVSGNILKRRS